MHNYVGIIHYTSENSLSNLLAEFPKHVCKMMHNIFSSLQHLPYSTPIQLCSGILEGHLAQA